jgi:hypothetical protein
MNDRPRLLAKITMTALVWRPKSMAFLTASQAQVSNRLALKLWHDSTNPLNEEQIANYFRSTPASNASDFVLISYRTQTEIVHLVGR